MPLPGEVGGSMSLTRLNTVILGSLDAAPVAQVSDSLVSIASGGD